MREEEVGGTRSRREWGEEGRGKGRRRGRGKEGTEGEEGEEGEKGKRV